MITRAGYIGNIKPGVEYFSAMIVACERQAYAITLHPTLLNNVIIRKAQFIHAL
jgi:hypothetical protein